MTIPHELATLLVPHANAIILGIFTLAGVYLTSRFDRSLRRRDFIVNALERSYGHALDAKKEVNRRHEALIGHLQWGDAADHPVSLPAHVLDDVALLVSICVPKLRNLSDSAIAGLERLGDEWNWRRPPQTGTWPPAFPEQELSGALHHFNAAVQRLLDAIRAEVSESL